MWSTGSTGSSSASDESWARTGALADVGLADRADVWPRRCQAVRRNGFRWHGRWSPNRELLLLDEPFGALDALTRLTMRGLLLDLWREHGFGVLLVTHDVDEAVALADRVLVLEEGRVMHTLTIDEPRPPAGEAYCRQPRVIAPSCSTSSACGSDKHIDEGNTPMTASPRPLAVRVAVLAMIVGLLAACVSRQDSSGAKDAPTTVPLSELSGLTLQVGDQKGGTEALLRAAGALDDLPVQGRVLHIHLRSAAGRGGHGGQDRLRDHGQHAADLRRRVQRQGEGGLRL